MEDFAQTALKQAPFLVIPLVAILAVCWFFVKYLQKRDEDQNAERTRAACALEKLSTEVVGPNTLMLGRVSSSLDRANAVLDRLERTIAKP